jgi:hypothetical protein
VLRPGDSVGLPVSWAATGIGSVVTAVAGLSVSGLAALVGMLTAAAGLLMQWHFNRLRDKRERAREAREEREHQAKLAEHQARMEALRKDRLP